MLKPNFSNIPEELQQSPQWVNWRLVPRKDGGKPTKPPYQPSGQLAKTDDSSTWSTFSSVEGAAPQHDGIGFVLTKDDPYVGLDFDHCRCPAFDGLDDEIDREIANGLNMVLPEVADHIGMLNSYTEVSPSGKGIRVFLKGMLPVDGKRKGPIEIYQAGRYLTMTGHVVEGFPLTIEHRQQALDAFIQNVFGNTEKPIEGEKKAKTDTSNGNWKERLEKAFKSKNGAEIQRLYSGDYSAHPSQSEADLSLAAHLAFWFSGDAAAIDSAFRQSGFFREKWDKKNHGDGRTYGEATIEKAISGCNSFYGERQSQEGKQRETMPATENPSQEKPFDATIQRLAALSPLQYDLVRKTEARALGVRPATLDATVKSARKGSENDNLLFIETEPWPTPIDPATLLTDIVSTIQRFIVCPKEVSHAVALWIAMTWFIDVVEVAPLAVITSPERRCGKTQLLTLLGRLSARAITASNISPAALFRTIEASSPTLLLDEADSFMKDNEDMRGLLNSGHTRDSAYVIRTVGENFTPTKFSTWGAKALASIGHIADTLMDRAVILELRRRLPHEKVERIRRYTKSNLFDDLRAKLARFAEDYCEDVRDAQPPLPDSLNDRAQDNWETLLAIAMTAGDEWLKIGTTAALKLTGSETAVQTIGTDLLSDIQEIFVQNKCERISTEDLIKALCANEEEPWKTYSKGFPITPRQLANKLKAYGIHSKSIRIGDTTAKGYEKDKFADAFSRYIPITPSASVTASQPTPVADLPAFPSVTQEDDVTDIKRRNLLIVKECDVVTDKNPRQPELALTEADFAGVTL